MRSHEGEGPNPKQFEVGLRGYRREPVDEYVQRLHGWLLDSETRAENAVEAGLYAVWERLSDGRLFVFNSLQNWLSEFRIYRRDEKGKIVKQNDHLMDATRYLIMSGMQVACREPREEDEDNRQWIDSTRNEYTGY